MNNPYPKKLYVELTTRCNLHCAICVKYTHGSCITEDDLPPAVFKGLASSLAHVETLILNGIGEPLLYTELEEIISFARTHMKPGAFIGFQSNGLLLDEMTSLKLISAGLTTVCLSLDSLETSTVNSTGEHSVAAVAKAIAGLVKAKKRVPASRFRIGLEMVLTRHSIRYLPEYIEWAADNGANYVIVTHILPYDSMAESLSLFNPNSSEATKLLNTFTKRAATKGISLADCLATYLKFNKTEADKVEVQLFEELRQEARTRDIRLHLQSLLKHNLSDTEKVEHIFAKAETIAARNNIELFLPSQQALSKRSCPFITEQAIFIAASGEVMPCHFLWHTYSCRVLGEKIQVQAYSLGTIHEHSLEKIWQSSQHMAFRQEAGLYEYAHCWSCSQGPCASLINDNLLAAHDCYGSQVPCGHCQWNLGGIRCL